MHVSEPGGGGVVHGPVWGTFVSHGWLIPVTLSPVPFPCRTRSVGLHVHERSPLARGLGAQLRQLA